MTEQQTRKTHPYHVLFFTSLGVGFTTFGGGLAMIAQMARIYVDQRRWLTQEEINHDLAIAQSLPGVIVVNMAALMGVRLRGFRGGLVCALGSILPSLITLCALTSVYTQVIENPYVLGAMRGIRAAVAALLVDVVVRMGKSLLVRKNAATDPLPDTCPQPPNEDADATGSPPATAPRFPVSFFAKIRWGALLFAVLSLVAVFLFGPIWVLIGGVVVGLCRPRQRNRQ